MPIIKSAIKKLRKDRKRTILNKAKKENLKALIKKARANKTPENLRAVFSALDKAAKTNLIHKNKAARLKSRLSKGVTQIPSKPATKKSTQKKKPVKKVAKTGKRNIK
ncbi:MAG: small subunit ribosomal protein S20 [Microgenomates group bacterium Gr01-1014_93]|nr:MAG: small subunit ribosomal protein S20 [Microgenomates group bacterium Gr01-1014_93]